MFSQAMAVQPEYTGNNALRKQFVMRPIPRKRDHGSFECALKR